jgi:uncharacterized protein DUF4167
MNTVQVRPTKNARFLATQLSNDKNPRQHYERYLSRARDEERAGNIVEAENYYQHAEHYFRSIK